MNHRVAVVLHKQRIWRAALPVGVAGPHRPVVRRAVQHQVAVCLHRQEVRTGVPHVRVAADPPDYLLAGRRAGVLLGHVIYDDGLANDSQRVPPVGGRDEQALLQIKVICVRGAGVGEFCESSFAAACTGHW